VHELAQDFFPGFAKLDVEAGDVSFRGRIGGSGSPVLLLHGYPQTHVAWRLIAPTLARSHTVIVPDLPGYGDSRTCNDQPRWTKRRVASALVALMDRLGHERFMDTILMFGSAGIRSHPFPVRPLEDLDPVLGAISDCNKGRTDKSIPYLERRLRDNRITVPPR